MYCVIYPQEILARTFHHSPKPDTQDSAKPSINQPSSTVTQNRRHITHQIHFLLSFNTSTELSHCLFIRFQVITLGPTCILCNHSYRGFAWPLLDPSRGFVGLVILLLSLLHQWYPRSTISPFVIDGNTRSPLVIMLPLSSCLFYFSLSPFDINGKG